MWAIISGIAVPIFGALSRFLGPIMAGIAGWRAGRSQVQAAQTQAVADSLQRQDQAAAKAPHDQDEVVKALRDGRF